MAPKRSGKGSGQKVRVEFRKNRTNRTRVNDLTRDAAPAAVVGENATDEEELDDLTGGERLSGKGNLSRRRTVVAEERDGQLIRDVDVAGCLAGRVISAIGLHCLVETEAAAGDAGGERYECTVRRVLRTLARDGRNAVVTGDRVLIRPQEADGVRDAPGGAAKKMAVVERVEPRHGVISREHKNREHVLVANVDQVVIVVSAADPPLKPALIDRMLVSAEKGGVGATIAVNKCDLPDADRPRLEELAALYESLGYPTVLASARTGEGVDRIRALLAGSQSVVAGQSGVGKSSLLNVVEPGWSLRVGEVSGWTGKGRHTTRRAILLRLTAGGVAAVGDDAGWVADTPGVRQFALWDVANFEVEAYFREFQPHIPHCKYPDCTHTHEDGCAVKAAVLDGAISRVRYDSYVRIISGTE
ncbi:ribosome small subunit-dependent GTPase A [Alienimonas californiensis]|uniref:Small ribosomal subunit biogenesis GTPase RsgA n=1 Tax=Alienimonas californiensis TaxID=2527989 RepID=A0A517PDL0_9PLAN|nr:ribosome small subunit-dependent GTPase A [Alienimonas californiensis]QDT17462.1 Putative ribosome biogenesis GTPase RsgA [Alienimonas californiensis]